MPSTVVRRSEVTEVTFDSREAPSQDAEVDAAIVSTDDHTLRIPAFFSKGHWRARFSSAKPGTYRLRFVLPGAASPDGVVHEIVVKPAPSDNALFRHGPVSVRGRGFFHADGHPFFWLGDSWWLALSGRIRVPDELDALAIDRRAKGFTVVQVVAGLFPDMPPFDSRGANAGGLAWPADLSGLNPSYFDDADTRIERIVGHGLVPCIVGGWGYHAAVLGEAKLKRHWRHLVARYAAYPVFWCIAGETAMPYYGQRPTEDQRREQTRAWAGVAAHVRAIDGFHRPIATHSWYMSSGVRELGAGLLDFDMVQSSHGAGAAAEESVRHVAEIAAEQPEMPVVQAEANYEGLFGSAWQDTQRYVFWGSLLSGAAGFTYGANGLFQLNRPGDPFGASPSGVAWGEVPWAEAMRFDGSSQLGHGRALFERFAFSELRPCSDAVRGAKAFCAAIGDRVRIVYLPTPIAPSDERARLGGLRPGSRHRGSFVNPRSGDTIDLGAVTADEAGSWQVPLPPVMRDWLLVVEAL